MIVTFVVAEAAVVVIVNVVEVVPAGTVTSPGTVTFEALDDNMTAVPPLGAGPLMVTVPVLGLPPGTVVGEHASPRTSGGFTVKVVVTETNPIEAVIVAVAAFVTGTVVIEKVADEAPAGTVTLNGIVITELFV